jgi:hypothetical protein
LDLSGNLSNSFEYAKKLFSDIGRLILLIVLNVIPLVNWIVVGYDARVLRESPSGEAPPKLENYSELFVDGAKIFFASLVYMLIPLILIGAGIGSFIGALVMGGMAGQFATGAPTGAGIAALSILGGTGIVLLLIGLILAFLMLIILAAGIAHMVKTGKFSKAFAFGEIFKLIGKIGWGKYLVWIILVVIISCILGAVYSVPYVGWLIAIIVGPVLAVFIFRSLGILYNDGQNSPNSLAT